MTNPMINPSYSGVTIQIANPAVNVGRNAVPGVQYCTYPQCYTAQNTDVNAVQTPDMSTPQFIPEGIQPKQLQGQVYPAQYYLNNYNYQNGGVPAKAFNSGENSEPEVTNIQEVSTPEDIKLARTAKNSKEYEVKQEEPQDLSKSQSVIDDLDARAQAAEAEKKNSTQKRVVALTDEYIKSLENYLNNPNEEIRLMASKEILTRLDEDKDRYDDAALNALLNKMLQDPSKLIRVASLSAFSSQLASGNDYTVQLLHNIQQNPAADKEDVLQAADILLKMSGGTEVKNIPNPSIKENGEQKE